jgi:hypothetical protein
MIKSLKYLSFLLILLVIGCDSPEEIESKEILVEEKQPYILLISKDDRNEHIRTWIRSLDAEIIIKQCYGMPKDSLDYYLNIADAIIIGGGEDVNPTLYNKPGYVAVYEYFENEKKLDFRLEKIDLTYIVLSSFFSSFLLL